jgi:hypothetical protein
MRIKILILLIFLTSIYLKSQDLGLKTGVAIGDLDQFFFGVLTPIPVEKLLIFQPTFDVGFGDNATSLFLSMDFLYRLRRNFSVGGGIGVLYNSFSRGGSKTDPSLSMFFNFRYPARRTDIFWEIRAQISNYSQLRLSFGFFL